MCTRDSKSARSESSRPLIAVLAGESLAPGAGAALVVVATGIVLVGMSQDSSGSTSNAPGVRAALFAGAAALSFGASLYATGRVATDVPVSWAILPPRAIGVLAIAVPLALTARLRLTRGALRLVLVAGVAEVGGFASFALGVRHGIAVSAVLASEFGAVAALAAFVLFRERVVRLQLVGIAAIAGGVAVLSALQA